MSLGEVDDTLIGATTEGKCGIEEGEDKGTIHESVYIAKEWGTAWVAEDLFVGVAGVAPDILISLLLDTAEDMCEAFGVVEGISSAEGDTV